MTFANPAQASLDQEQLPPGRLMLCLLGGGQDGDRLADAFSQAEFPRDAFGVIVTGPFMLQPARERLQQRAAKNPQLRVVNFISEPTVLVERAERIVAMGGYNTVCEVLSFEKRALIVPRVKPRQEQIIRAKRLRDLGLIDLLEMDRLAPEALTGWMAKDLPPLRMNGCLNLNGLQRLPELAMEVLGKRTPATPASLPAPGEVPALELA